ncbi:hypothetical protein I2I11_09825 [Pontibacter sp. 172403-2]|uniref:hypothetical protein n=1 Tax=Pontibacter rufus TaxID=2791028 RepID=UPI0018AF820C|nr:hypothetical protein [Pontibacter sp. 172403-2]MBF9253589.1 hypothetical protein [Pontibacter sp. 172403-2]
MPLNPKLQKLLEKTYAPQERFDSKFSDKDITYITNESGEPVTLFIGRRQQDGSIAGERYVRRIIREANSSGIARSHWELKGKVSRGN